MIKNEPTNVVTIGIASRLIPLNCRKPTLIDTTQIDFVPYTPNSLPKLKNIIEKVYGLNFSSRIVTSNVFGFVNKPNGSIDEKLVSEVWALRSKLLWSQLGDEFKFKYLINQCNKHKNYVSIHTPKHEKIIDHIIKNDWAYLWFKFNIGTSIPSLVAEKRLAIPPR